MDKKLEEDISTILTKKQKLEAVTEIFTNEEIDNYKW